MGCFFLLGISARDSRQVTDGLDEGGPWRRTVTEGRGIEEADGGGDGGDGGDGASLVEEVEGKL